MRPAMRPQMPTPRAPRINPASRARQARHVLVAGGSLVVLSALAASCGDRAHEVAGSDGNARNEAAVAVAPTAPSRFSTSVMPQPAAGVMADRAEMSKAADEAYRSMPNEAGQSAAPPAAPAPGAPSFSAVSQASTSSSMIIRTGYAGLEVDSLDAAIARVRLLAQRVGGFVANTQVQGGKDQLRSASLEVKVPSDRFDRSEERRVGK